MVDLLDSNNKVENLGDNLVSFKDCPNHCVDGKIVDPYKHKKIPCPYCAEKRLQFAKGDLTDKSSGKTISELLDLPTSFMGNEFNEETVIPDFARKSIKQETLDNVLRKMRELITDISIGNIPSCSIMFNLGKKSNEANFIYPYLIKGYVSGRTLVPLVNLIDLCQLRLQYEGSSYSLNIGKNYNYNDLVTRDICVVVIDAGATYTSLQAVKGLMQLRAQKLKPTVIFTNSWNNYVRDMCSENGFECYNLATLYSVEYEFDGKSDEPKSLDEKIESQISPTVQSKGYGMSSDSLRSLMTAKNTL